MCNAAARVGSRNRLMNDCRRLRRGGNSLGVEGDIAEQQIRLGRLEIVDAAQLAHHVAGKGKDRRVVAGCFIKAGDEVRAAGTGRTCADAEAAGQLGLPRSGECCSLLMPNADPLYLAAANRVAQRVEGITDQAEHLPNPDLFEHADQDVCYHLSHVTLLAAANAATLAASKKIHSAQSSGRASAGWLRVNESTRQKRRGRGHWSDALSMSGRRRNRAHAPQQTSGRAL